MDAKGRGAIELVAIAYGAVAALVFLQTLLLTAIPYDSSAFAGFVAFFRIAFFATDVAILVALVRLGARHAPVKPFAFGGVAIAIFSVASGVFGLLSHALGTPTSTERMLQNFARTMSAAEPSVAIGTAVLVLFALAAVGRAKSSASADARPVPRAMSVAWYVFFTTATLWLLVTLARASSRDAQSITIAWVVWALEIVKPLAVAVGAFAVRRAFAGTPIGEDAPKVGPYREGEGAAPPSTADGEAAMPPPDPATIAPLQRAAAGVRLYSLAFTLRLAFAFILTILSLAAMGSHDLWIVFALLPASGAATAVAMSVGLARQRALPSMSAGSRLLLAQIALGIAAVSDGFFTLAVLLAGLTSSSWGAERKASMAWAMAYPTSAFFVGLSILLVAGALARSGEAFGREALTHRARWAQSLAVATFSFALGLFFAVAAISGHDSGETNGGALVCAGLFLAAGGTAIAFVVMHVLTQAEAARTLRARLGMAA